LIKRGGAIYSVQIASQRTNSKPFGGVSTVIEGNALVLEQVEALLSEGRAVGSKELREYMDGRYKRTVADADSQTVPG
jgi:hypothetical protein